jgi:hypothetical protein
MRTLLIVLAAFAIGCTQAEEDGTEDILSNYGARVSDIDGALQAYVTAVAAATTVAEVVTLQATYDQDTSHAMEELHHVMEDIEGCEHDATGAGLVVDAHASVEAIEDAIADLLTDHGSHSEVGMCQSAATAHETEVGEEIDALEGHHDAWHDDMHCAHHDDGEEEHGH